jgi:hypothetical protein
VRADGDGVVTGRLARSSPADWSASAFAMLSAVGTNEGIELLLNRLAKTETNAAFLASLQKGAEASA